MMDSLFRGPTFEMNAIGRNQFYVSEILADTEFIAMPKAGMEAKVKQPTGAAVADRVGKKRLRQRT